MAKSKADLHKDAVHAGAVAADTDADDYTADQLQDMLSGNVEVSERKSYDQAAGSTGRARGAVAGRHRCPKLTRLTRRKPVTVEIDLGDGDTLVVEYDRNRVTPNWVGVAQDRVNAQDVLATSTALAEVILQWDVTDDGAAVPADSGEHRPLVVLCPVGVVREDHGSVCSVERRGKRLLRHFSIRPLRGDLPEPPEWAVAFSGRKHPQRPRPPT